jgi:molybdenum cofactor biosynthesis protein B
MTDPTPAPQLHCLVLTSSDSRTLQTDRGGAFALGALTEAGHHVVGRHIVADDITAIRALVLDAVEQDQLDVLIVTGGTALAGRDVTPEAISPLFSKVLPGFGETLRRLAFERWGARALLSRASAGVIARTLVYLLPGNPETVELAMEQLVLPMLADGCSQVHAHKRRAD